MKLPRLYAIVDKTPNLSNVELATFLRELLAAGLTLIQYRNKQGRAAEMLQDVRELKRIVMSAVKHKEIRLIVNDRADICVGADADGIHLGQDDMTVEAGRLLCASPTVVGVSTHNLAQLEAANATSADYIAFGPIFATMSKMNPDPVVGLNGLSEARKRTKKPLVAIGGITLENCRQAIDAGADAVAVISALVKEPKRAAEEFLRKLL